MAEASPEDPAWLDALVVRSALMPDATFREHWRRLIPWLPTGARYELAATLLDAEHWLSTPGRVA
jgi:hypothetical protein